MNMHATSEHQGAEDASAKIYRIRHSLAHVLAKAVQDLYPGTTLGFGPPIADGFYYDFVLAQPIGEDDFPKIEARMREILREDLSFDREELPTDEAYARIDGMQEPYKREYAQELVESQSLDGLTFYRTGAFVDMCDGPHVESTKEIPQDCFKLRRIAGAYWRGDSDNVMMTRIYAWCFENKKELRTRIRAYEEGLKRDHKKLGKELDLFVIDNEVGRGLPLWLPNGTVLRDELEKLAVELEFKAGYQRVSTPHLAREELYWKTGHLPHYADKMFPVMVLDEEEDGNERYLLKPMNCPHHHRIFDSKPRSYRDLPIRYAEYGTVYRREDSGALSGLLRVRGMHMNDAHIYCTREQITEEVGAVLAMHQEVYDILGLTDYYMRLSLRDQGEKAKEKYVDDAAAWDEAEQALEDTMKELGIPYRTAYDEAAFYGPKVDVQFMTVTGREETGSTVQLDFAVPNRLGLTYTGPDDEQKPVYIIHRAPLGTHERFVAFLIEHFGGAFPLWLAPVQVCVLPVSEEAAGYAKELNDKLRAERIRAQVDMGSDTISKRVRHWSKRKVPVILVVGAEEMKSNTVSVRLLGSRRTTQVSFDTFLTDAKASIAARKRTPLYEESSDR